MYTFITKFHGHFTGMKIHISESTKSILETFHDYTITERGETDVKVSICATTDSYQGTDYLWYKIDRAVVIGQLYLF